MADNVHINSPYDRGEAAGRLYRGETHLSYAETDIYKAPARLYGQAQGGAYQLPGRDLYVPADVMPVRVLENRASATVPGLPGNPDGYLFGNVLIYRSGTTPRRDGPRLRALPASVTVPGDSARFMDGSRGNVYG